MTNISQSPFTDEIEQAEPPCKFSMPYFISFKGDRDPKRHLKHYRNTMVLYQNNDVFMCKIFATTLQGVAQDWFHTLPSQSIQNFDDLSLVFIKEYSSYRSIKKKSDHLFNIKKNPKESLRNYVKRFKAEKAKIVGYSFALTEKHALWTEAQRAEKAPEQPQKESVAAQMNEDGKQPNKVRQEAKRRD
ncbi:hypothetical protein FF2_009875 [Malus domestica]